MNGSITIRSTGETAILPGNMHLLMEQIGSVEVLENLSGLPDSSGIAEISRPSDILKFLKVYKQQILEPLELPSICRAFFHANANEARELIEQDQVFGRERVLKAFAETSRRAGRAQLQRLRPLKDQRLAQKYLTAVEKGEAHGWHTLVYGVTLSVYSFPLRTGLVTYCSQIIRGFIRSASEGMVISRAEEDALFDELSASIPAVVEKLISSAPSEGCLKF